MSLKMPEPAREILDKRREIVRGLRSIVVTCLARGAINAAIVGVMLESFLVEGRQDLGDGSDLTHGQSITDACIAWDDTVGVLERLATAVRARRAK